MNIKKLEWVTFLDKKGKPYFYAIGIRYCYKIIQSGGLFQGYQRITMAKSNVFMNYCSDVNLDVVKTLFEELNQRFVNEEFKKITGDLSRLERRWKEEEKL